MDVIKKIDRLMNERQWSDYRLSLESGLSSSTIANIHRRNTVPSITTLEAICNAFGITLAQFFNEDDEAIQLDPDQRELFDNWLALSAHQKNILAGIINEFKTK